MRAGRERRSPVPDAPSVRAEAEVRLWGDTVGAVVELDSGRILFEYADEFRASGVEISPIHLSTELAGPRSFEELRHKPAFEGLPGVLADALPDAFGRAVIRAYHTVRDERGPSPVQRLLYLGERGLGALTFHPPDDLLARPEELESLEVQALARDARRIVEGRADVAIPEMYRIGSSAGGKQPKAIVHYHPTTANLRSGAAPRRADEIACIVKFDGVRDGDGKGELGPPGQYNRVEAAYGDMARAAGVDMAEIDLLDVQGYAHLLIHRFDSHENDRLHQHTFGGLIHVDYDDPGASSYEEYFRTILSLGMAYDALRQAYRRLVFNVMAVNQDDHVKNLSFHMSRKGEWSLTPAYDLTFAHGTGWTANHQMRLRDKTTDIREADLLSVAGEFGIKRPGHILEETRQAVAGWERFAAAYEVTPNAARYVRRELDERAEMLAG